MFSPTLIFNFDHVRAAVAMIEGAIEKERAELRVATSAARRATRAVQDPNHSFLEDPVMAPLAVAIFDSALTFPMILRRAMLIAIASHVEHVLRRWCAWLHEEWRIQRTEKELWQKGESDVHRCMRYLRDETGLALGDFEKWQEWAPIDGYRVARNCLAHNGGIVESKDRARLASLPALTVEEDGLLAADAVIVLDAGACEAAVEAAKAFMDRLSGVAQQDPRAAGVRLPSE
jgi:hypothetical protein